MGRQTHRLTDIKVKSLKSPGMHPDGEGLYLRITAGGTKSWMYRYRSGGRLRDMGLGKYPALPLSSAREAAAEAYALRKRGLDPIDERKRQQARGQSQLTFEDAAERFIASHEDAWRNAKHRQQWHGTLTTYANPVIGKMPVAAIQTADMLRILEPTWKTKAETASRVRGRIENVLDWAKVRGLREGENPARWRGHLAHLLPAGNKARTVRHYPALPWRDMPEFMAELRANTSLAARALEFTILTCVRTAEALAAQWTEFEEREAVWTVPKERIKAGREHRVPLAGAALEILRDLPRRGGNPFLFPGKRPRRPLSCDAMLKLLGGMRPGCTVHGFRSAFRDWVAEATDFPRELAEMALAHIVGSAVERAYQRGDLFEKRRKLMGAWAEFCHPGRQEGKAAPITPRLAGHGR